MLIKALEEIEAAARGKKRLDTVAALIKTVPNLEKFLVEANHPFITFGVAKLPPPSGGGLFFQDDVQWVRDLFAITARLASRSLSGHEARDNIARHLDDANMIQRKWASRLLLRDLRLNFGAKDLQKILGKEVIPLFEVPLAKDYNDVESDGSPDPWIVEPKLDGGRCVAMIASDGSVEFLSRTGKIWGNFESVRKALTTFVAKNSLPLPYVLDGEVVSLDDDGKINFQQIQKTMHRKDGVEIGRLQYVIFDGCPLSEWRDPRLAYLIRLENVKTVLGSSELPPELRVIESELQPYTKETAAEACKTFMAQGYEGAMFRKAGAVVENKRSKLLLKVKLFQDAEAEIYDAVEGTGKYLGMLGALKCRLPGVDGADGVEFEIGSGYDDATRQELWADKPLGKTASFKFFELTDAGAPRFPIYKAIRHPSDIGEVE